MVGDEARNGIEGGNYLEPATGTEGGDPLVAWLGTSDSD